MQNCIMQCTKQRGVELQGFHSLYRNTHNIPTKKAHLEADPLRPELGVEHEPGQPQPVEAGQHGGAVVPTVHHRAPPHPRPVSTLSLRLGGGVATLQHISQLVSK